MAPHDQTVIAQVGEVLERQVTHLNRLVEDLLDVSRITRGVLSLERRRTTVAELLSASVDANRALLDARQHKLIVETPAEPLELEVDPMRIAQVFTNIIQNAAKYTGEGGKIAVVAARCGEEIEVRVRDDGIGMSAEMLSRAFHLFAQGEVGSERSATGLGVGLHLSRSLVELHGGSLTATSCGPGQGSEFVVRLPASSPQKS
jgi:signal transduction histidine kinase